MSKEYLNEDDLIRRGDVIAAIDKVDCIGATNGCPADKFNLNCQFARAALTVPPANEKVADNTEIVLDFATVKKKMELAEKILELDRKIARLDKFLVDIGDDKNKTCSMVFTCDTVMPFTDIDLADAKSMLRKYRDNLRVKLDTLWNEFATIDPYKMKEAE